MAETAGSNLSLLREALEAAVAFGPWLPYLQMRIRRAGGPEVVLAAALEELGRTAKPPAAKTGEGDPECSSEA